MSARPSGQIASVPIRTGIVLAAATILFFGLLLHKSDAPVILGRYSISFALEWLLLGVNLALLWWQSRFQESLSGLSKRNVVTVIAVVGLVLGVVFCLDLVGIRMIDRPVVPILSVLFCAAVLQIERIREREVVVLRRVSLMVLSFVFAITLAEVVFRSAMVRNLTPNSQDEFEALIRDQWPDTSLRAHDSDAFTILGLADSFGVVGGTSKNYHFVLQEMLQGETGGGIDVMNVSVPGYQPLHELNILPYALSYAPDLVLHGVFVGNDFSTASPELYVFKGISLVREVQGVPYAPHDFLLPLWIRNVSQLYDEKRRRRMEVGGEEADPDVDEATFSKQKYLEIQFDRLNLWGRDTPEDIARMEKIFPLLDQIRMKANAAAARYVMVIHPDETQVNSELRQEIVTTFNLNHDDYNFNLPQDIINRYCREREVPCLDLLPVIREHAKDHEMFLPRNTHYNERGNRVAAAAIQSFLKEQGIVHSRQQWEH